MKLNFFSLNFSPYKSIFYESRMFSCNWIPGIVNTNTNHVDIGDPIIQKTKFQNRHSSNTESLKYSGVLYQEGLKTKQHHLSSIDTLYLAKYLSFSRTHNFRTIGHRNMKLAPLHSSFKNT
uniref:Uncharacterized protein n=1 Tax=Cacopsylla melanoneura TaxID=428564 RepID=A0A8D8ZAZ1_9HEMI